MNARNGSRLLRAAQGLPRGIAVFDQTSFAKFLLVGRDAEKAFMDGGRDVTRRRVHSSIPDAE
jgi:hypothetical protein